MKEEIIKNANEMIYNAECWLDDEEYTGLEEREWAEFEKSTIKGLLDLYEKEKEKNKKLQEKCKELVKEKEELSTAILYDNIHKDKIREKIEEINNEKLNYSEDEWYLENEIKGYAIDKIKEILEEE